MKADTPFLVQLDQVHQEFLGLESQAKYEDLSDLDESVIVRVLTRARAAIHRIAGSSSPYARQCEEIIKLGIFVGGKARQLDGVVESLRADLGAGYLRSLAELIHGEVFVDFLEMAEHLVNEGYKDAAAVIAGSTLESHLHQLCHKAQIPLEIPDPAGARPKKADMLNAELVKSGVYTNLDQKNVTSWLALRNDAAHGHYNRYEQGQVKLLIASIRDFITRNPA